MDLDQTINERHCVNNFKETKKPNYKDVIKAIEAASKAPAAGNLPAIKYILVSDKDKIQELAQAAQQSFIGKAHYVIAVTVDKSFLEKYYYDRADHYAHQQAGASIENFLLKITDLGLASCWIGAFSDETVKRILKIPKDIDIVSLLPIGYELSDIKPKKMKPDLNTIVFFDKYKNKNMKPERKPIR
jgi:nitroreductase